LSALNLVRLEGVYLGRSVSLLSSSSSSSTSSSSTLRSCYSCLSHTSLFAFQSSSSNTSCSACFRCLTRSVLIHTSAIHQNCALTARCGRAYYTRAHVCELACETKIDRSAYVRDVFLSVALVIYPLTAYPFLLISIFSILS
jgi:hypothetical protein